MGNIRYTRKGKDDVDGDGPEKKQGNIRRDRTKLKKKRKRTLVQVTMESRKADLKEVGMARKKRHAQNFKTLFKKQRVQEFVPEDDGVSARGEFDYLERLSSNENSNALESKSSTCLASSREGSVNLESCEAWAHLGGIMPSLSPKHDYHNLMGICILCSKNKRVGYDMPEEELCTCNPAENDDLCSFSAKAGDDHGAVGQGTSYEDAEILYCGGKSCTTIYHRSQLDCSLAQALPVVWYCSQCVNKKLLFGAPSVSKRAELIWDVRDVVTTKTGVRQKQYLVKYHGLAHVHNHWVTEKQVLLENPSLIPNFIETKKTVKWCRDWTVPERLLRRRVLQDSIYIASATVISACNYEWLVKWRGLSCDHATWELECAPFLGSSLAQTLINDYESRRERAHKEVNKHQKGSIVKLSKLPAIWSPRSDNLLKNVNKLRKYLSKCWNAVVFDDEERVLTILVLIQSMSQICWPFLIVTASSTLSHWEAKFAELVPSVDVVVYSGNRTTREVTRKLEFYDEEGYMMLQVLLTSAEALLEDLNILRSIKWEAIVIDEHQQSWASADLEQIKMLNTDSRILLSSGPLKDTSAYLRILSLLECQGDFGKLRGLESETNGNLCKLRERLSGFIAYGRNSQVSKFLEYWVPVEISNFQLEQYCSTLLLNSALRSCSRMDCIGALQDVLTKVRKCCDHPYLLDASVQERLVAEQRSPSDLLDIGIKASGKLQVLDMMLTEMKARGLVVVILFQSITGEVGASTGDILDDFLRQRFGQNTYERVDAITSPKNRQAAVNRFNNKETGQFAFLLENRACTQLLKLSSLDAIIIYDSDWNPANDLKVLQKNTVDSNVGKIKVFRLYSCFTVEERALVLAKDNLNLVNCLDIFKRTKSDSLLSWGAIDLFRRLDEYHADSNTSSDLTISADQGLLKEVTKEFRVILSGNCDETYLSGIISKAKLGAQSYTTDVPVLGESKVHLKEGEQPHLFWKNLLQGKNPRWKHLSSTGRQNRKRVHSLVGSVSKSATEKADVVKKHKRMTNNMDTTLTEAERDVEKGPRVSVSRESEGIYTFKASNGTQILRKDNFNPKNDHNYVSGQRLFVAEASAGEQESLSSSLQGKLTRLCEILLLSEDVTDEVRRFSEYVIKNHRLNTDSPSIMQAFQISLCWIAASIKKQKVDRKDALMLAKQHLNYQCSEEQVNSIYSKMRSLKWMYLQSPDNTIGSAVQCSLAEVDTCQGPSNVSLGGPQLLLHEKKLRKCNERLKKLTLKHQGEIEQFHKIWEKRRMRLESDYKLESALIRSIHYGLDQAALRMDKLKLLEDNFAKKIEEHDLLKNAELEELQEKHLASENEEKRKKDQLLVKARVCPRELRAGNGSESHGSHSEDDPGCVQPNTRVNIMRSGEAFPMGQDTDQNQSKSFCTVENDDAPSITSETAPTEAQSSGTLVETMSTVNLQSDEEEWPLSLDVTKHLNQSKHSCDYDENNLGNISAREDQPVDANEEDGAVFDTVVSEIAGRVCTLGLSNASNKELSKGSEIALPDTLVSQRNEACEVSSGDLRNPEQTLERLEEAVSIPDDSESLPQQEQQDAVGESLASVDTPAIQNLCTLNSEGTIVEPINTAVTRTSNHELTVPDEILATVPSNDKVPATENSAELHSQSADAAPLCNQPPAIEDHDPGRSIPPAAELCGARALPHESTSGVEESLETHGVDGDIGPVTDVGDGHSVESSVSPQSTVTIPPIGVGSVGQANQAVQSAGIVIDHGPGSLVHPTVQPSHWTSTHFLSPDPLQNEFERMLKENEQFEKNQEILKSQLNLECDKEIQELIAQTRKKYDLKIQEAEADCILKKNEADRKKKVVFMNKILALAFRSKCWDPRTTGLPNIQQGVASSFMQHLFQVPPPPPVRPFPVASSSQPAQPQPVTTPPAMQSPRQPYNVRPSPVPSQRATTTPPTYQVQRAPPPISRPLVISTISPSGNPGVSGEIRAPAPHLQSFRCRPPVGLGVSTSPSSSQQAPPSQPVQLSSPPPPLPPVAAPRLPLVSNIVSENRQPEPQVRLAAPPNQSIPTATETDDLPATPELSAFENRGHAQDNQVSATPADGLVCLSDDD